MIALYFARPKFKCLATPEAHFSLDKEKAEERACSPALKVHYLEFCKMYSIQNTVMLNQHYSRPDDSLGIINEPRVHNSSSSLHMHHTHTHMLTHIYTHTYTHTHKHTQTHTNTHTYTHTCMHTHKHTCIYTHTHIL